MQDIKEAVTIGRRAFSLTQRALAARADVTVNTVSKAEAGGTITLESAHKLLAAIGKAAREARRSRNLTRAEVARRCKLDPEIVTSVEEGRVIAAGLLRRVLAQGLGLEIDQPEQVA